MSLAYSFSAFEEFEQCAYKFYRIRIKRDVPKEPDNDAKLDGQRKHKSFENRIKDKKPLMPALAKYEPMIAGLERAGGELHAEQELVLTKDLKQTTWWSDDVWLRIKVDVALYVRKLGLTLDWKASKRRPKPYQLELGAMGMMLHYPELEKVSAAFVWLSDETTDPESYDRLNDLPRIIEKTQLKAARIEAAVQEDVWQPKPSPLCDYCPVRHTCDYRWKRGRR